MFGRTRLSSTIWICSRNYTQNVGKGPGSGTSSPPPPSSANTNVPGLSAAVIHPAQGPLGPGVDPNKSGAYKVPEYFCYDNMSYFEAEIEMAKYRLPQPSAIKKILKIKGCKNKIIQGGQVTYLCYIIGQHQLSLKLFNNNVMLGEKIPRRDDN